MDERTGPRERGPDTNTAGTFTLAPIRDLRDLVWDATRSLTGAQRAALVELLDEIGMGIAVVARAARDYPGEPGTVRAAQLGSWQRVVAAYTELMAAGDAR